MPNAVTKLINSNVVRESSFPISVLSTLAQPSEQTAKAAVEHKEEVTSLNLHLSLQAYVLRMGLP